MDNWILTSRRLGVIVVLAYLSLGALVDNEKQKQPRTLLKTPHLDVFDFNSAFEFAYGEVIKDSKKSCYRGFRGILNADDTPASDCYPRERVDVSDFSYKSKGGLTDSDRNLIADLYYKADSVFEYGIGESTIIAAKTNLPRYTGVDSSAEWVSMARSHAPDRFRFYFADIGPTKEWGNPVSNETLAKMALDYQIAPLRVERDPFDIYLVDGRWRVACVMASFLHAIQSGGDMNKIRVVLHDYAGRGGPTGAYGFVESIATIEQRSEKAIVLAMKDGVTNAEIFNAWKVRRMYCKMKKEVCSIELIRGCDSLFLFMLSFESQ
jgi:hypothetical protein